MHHSDPQRLLRHLVSVGARPGEIDALRWAQVDLDVRKITIDRAIKRADGGRPLSIGSDADRAHCCWRTMRFPPEV